MLTLLIVKDTQIVSEMPYVENTTNVMLCEHGDALCRKHHKCNVV